MNKVHNPGLDNQLLALINRILPSNYQLPLKQEMPSSTIQNIFSTAQVQVESPTNSSFVVNRLFRNRVLLLYIILGVTTLLVFLVSYQRFFQPEPNQASNIENLQNLQESGQFQQAIQLLEQMIQREPERVDLRLQLAQLFELTGKVADAEIG